MRPGHRGVEPRRLPAAGRRGTGRAPLRETSPSCSPTAAAEGGRPRGGQPRATLGSARAPAGVRSRGRGRALHALGRCLGDQQHTCGAHAAPLAARLPADGQCTTLHERKSIGAGRRWPRAPRSIEGSSRCVPQDLPSERQDVELTAGKRLHAACRMMGRLAPQASARNAAWSQYPGGLARVRAGGPRQ